MATERARRRGSLAAVRQMVDDLRREGVWSSADEALAEVAFELARTLDAGAGMATAAVARELRATLTQLRETMPGDDDGDWIADVSATVRHPSES